jgi:hypothetical protein
MFRAARRAVVYPQAEHAVFAGMIALAWGNEHFPLPPLPIDSFVRGVALHDRGYGELDVDEIGSVAGSRWVDTQRAGFGNHDSNPVVDLVASMHVCRLVSNAAETEAKSAHAEMTAELRRLCERAGVDESAAAAADAITDLCDRIAFDVCREEPGEGSVAIGTEIVRYRFDGLETVQVTPWPFACEALNLLLSGYRADAYPDRLQRLVEPIRFEAGSRNARAG